MKKSLLIMVFLCIFGLSAWAGSEYGYDYDELQSGKSKLKVYFIGHGSLMFDYQGEIIHIDPFSRIFDYAKLPKADYIFVTHHHGDHLDLNAIDSIKKNNMKLFMPQKCVDSVKGKLAAGKVEIGKTLKLNRFTVDTIKAYNMVNKRKDGTPFHIDGECVGFVFTFGDLRVYVAGDTENIPEMKALKNIDAAFLPMNLPFTMTPEMVADAAKSFKPKVLYPYHYGKTDTGKLVDLLKSYKNIDVRIKKIYPAK